jgi:metal-responsive CopG/Arc/MetJ family transcriptional regulator
MHTTMQETASIIICGQNERCMALASACIRSGIHPTILIRSDLQSAEQMKAADLHVTTDPFSCVADMVIDLSNDDRQTIIDRFNQLAEINHGDVVFAMQASSENVEDLASEIMQPARVIRIYWEGDNTDTIRMKASHGSSTEALSIADTFLQQIQNHRRNQP